MKTSRTNLLFIAAALLLAVIYIYGKPVGTEPFPEPRGGEEASLTEATAYFTETLQQKVISEVGQPIEGFEPFMFMTVYPGLVPQDFDGVEALLGMYVFRGGELTFALDDSGPIHSAAHAITPHGMDTLLENVSRRLGLPLTTIPEIDVILGALA